MTKPLPPNIKLVRDLFEEDKVSLSKQDLATLISKQNGITFAQASRELDHVLGGMSDALVAGHRNFRFDPYPKRCTGYVVDTLQTVCHCFFTTDSLEECLVETVNLGGDADTNGAIAGMLAGAYYGEEALPYRWLRRLDRPVQAHIGSQVDGLLALAWSRATGPKNKS